MKTWEMIKMLTENPNLIFEKPKRYFVGMVGGYLYYGDSPNKLNNIWQPGFFDDWTLVRTPVTWQEAIQAWSEGKTVRCEREGKVTCEYSQGGNKLTDQYGWGPEKDEFLTGTWFILDGDADE